MAGLGIVTENNGLFYSVAGGYIWDRNAEQDNPNYATQTYKKADGKEGVRSGARYAHLSGIVTDVLFRVHDKYGQNINVTVEAEGENYILSIGTDNRNCLDLMRALLAADLTKELYIKPYDFVDQRGKRVQGISFKQDGEKLNLRISGAPDKEPGWFKTCSRKEVRRFFEDLSEYFVAEVEEKIIPQFKKQEDGEPVKEKSVVKEEPVAKKAPSVIAMKKAIKAYIEENYEGEVMPKLDKAGVTAWYELVLAEEELPFDMGEDESDLDSQLDNLLSED